MFKQLAIILVNFESYQLTRELLDSLQNQTVHHFKVFISDLSRTKQSFTHSVNHQIILGDNKGFAHGNNLAIREAIAQGYEVFAVLNNDTRVDNRFVESCLESINQHQDDLIGAKIYYEAGYEYHKDRYSKNDLGHVLWYAGGYTDWRHAYSIHRGVDEVDHEQYNQAEDTDFITGCFMLYSKAIYERIGEWDEAYFLYYEDADFCERAKRKGIRLLYDPSIVVWHKISQSAGGSGSALQKKYQEKNRIKFCLRYGPLRTSAHLLLNFLLSKVR